MTPRIITSLGPAGYPLDTIVIDHRNHCLWRGHVAWPPAPTPNHQAFQTVSMALAVAAGRTTFTKEELFDHIWGDDPSGGPISGAPLAAAILYQCRAVIAWCGYKPDRISTSRYAIIPAGYLPPALPIPRRLSRNSYYYALGTAA